MIATLARLVSDAATAGISLGHAQRFFDVGEWSLAFDELLRAPEGDDFATLRANHEESFRRLEEWCGDS